MSLQLARSNKEHEIPFNDENLIACKGIASTIGGAQYLTAQVTQYVNRTKTPGTYKGVVENVKRFETDIIRQNSRASAWMLQSEKEVRSDFQTLQTNIAKDAVKELLENSEPGLPVQMGYAVNEDSEFLRFYSQNDEKLSDAGVHANDQLLNSFLSQNDMLTKDGVVYKAIGKEVEVDKAGNPIKADRDELVKILSTPESNVNQGFSVKTYADFLKEISQQQVDVETQQYDYPSEAPVVEVEPQAPQALKASDFAQEKTPEAPVTTPAKSGNEVEPEEPTAPGKMG